MFNMKSTAICLLLGFTSSLAFQTAEEVLKSASRRQLAQLRRRLPAQSGGDPVQEEHEHSDDDHKANDEGLGEFYAEKGLEAKSEQPTLTAEYEERLKDNKKRTALYVTGAIGVFLAALGTGIQFGEIGQEFSSKMEGNHYSPEWVGFGLGIGGAIIAIICFMYAFYTYSPLQGENKNIPMAVIGTFGFFLVSGLTMSAFSHSSAVTGEITQWLMIIGGTGFLCMVVIFFCMKIGENEQRARNHWAVNTTFVISLLALAGGASMAGYYMQEGLYDVHGCKPGNEGIGATPLVLTGLLLCGGLLALGLFMMVTGPKNNNSRWGMIIGTAFMVGSGAVLVVAMSGLKDYVTDVAKNTTDKNDDNFSNFLTHNSTTLTLFIVAGSLLAIGLIVTLIFRFRSEKCFKAAAK